MLFKIYLGLCYKKASKRRYIFLEAETDSNEYLAILPCIPCDSSFDQRIIVDLNGGPAETGSFRFVEETEQNQKDFGKHSGYSLLMNNRCSPNCILEGWRLDKGGEYRILVKTQPEDAPYGGDKLSADFGNDAIPCTCKDCKQPSTTATNTADDTDQIIEQVQSGPPLKKRTIGGY